MKKRKIYTIFLCDLKWYLYWRNTHKSNNRLSRRSIQVLFSLYSIVFNSSFKVKFSLSRSYFFSPNRFDLGKVDCSTCRINYSSKSLGKSCFNCCKSGNCLSSPLFLYSRAQINQRPPRPWPLMPQCPSQKSLFGLGHFGALSRLYKRMTCALEKSDLILILNSNLAQFSEHTL